MDVEMHIDHAEELEQDAAIDYALRKNK